MFERPTKVPVPFALAVYRVAHNQGSYADWEVLGEYPREECLKWIKSILEANGWTETLEEQMEWWARELSSFKREEDG